MDESRGRILAHAQWDGCELDLVTTSEGLMQLIGVLRNQEFGSYQLYDQPCVPSRTNMSTIEVNSGDGRLILKVETNVASLSGSQEYLAIFATNLERLMASWMQGEIKHSHIDPLSNPFLVSPESESFIVSQDQGITID